MKQKVFSQSATAVLPRSVYRCWAGAAAATAPTEGVAAVSVCVSVMTDALRGRKRILMLVFQALVYISFHLSTPFLCV